MGHSTPGTGFVQGNQLYSLTSWLEHCWATLLPEVVESPLKISLENTPRSGGNVIQLLAWMWAKWALGPTKLVLRGSKSGRSALHVSPLIKNTSQTLFCRQAKLLVGFTTWDIKSSSLSHIVVDKFWRFFLPCHWNLHFLSSPTAIL